MNLQTQKYAETLAKMIRQETIVTLYTKAPFVALLCLMHLGISLLFCILGGR